MNWEKELEKLEIVSANVDKEQKMLVCSCKIDIIKQLISHIRKSVNYLISSLSTALFPTKETIYLKRIRDLC